MKRPVLLDSSFLIALKRETAARKMTPARTFLTIRTRTVVVSIVSAELLEGAEDEESARRLTRDSVRQGFHLGLQGRWCPIDECSSGL